MDTKLCREGQEVHETEQGTTDLRPDASQHVPMTARSFGAAPAGEASGEVVVGFGGLKDADLFEVLPSAAWAHAGQPKAEIEEKSRVKRSSWYKSEETYKQSVQRRRVNITERDESLKARLKATTERAEKRKLNHNMIERRRREKMREALSALRATMPQTLPGIDDATVVERAVARMQELEAHVKDLQAHMKELSAQVPAKKARKS
mmetsp:Transcript_5623/g.11844  ORF Transcript_5623/g.11844 Transcript_5623/m.11844 type:complete len:206 (-) Transcript_5623:882-1499(-)